MTEKIKKPRRQRRTREAVEKDVLNAVTTLIEEVGFANVTLTGVAQRAQIEASVFYRRYDNLDELFDVYVRKYDYWLSGLAELMPTDLSDEDTFKWIMKNLSHALYKNRGMQQLLIWELSTDNYVTRRTATMREKVNESLIKLMESKFQHTGMDMNTITAHMISGIYYLILHKHMSKFCDVDFSTRKGKERLDNALDKMISILFSEQKHQLEKVSIAEKLRAEGVSEDVIAKCVNLVPVTEE
jgi:AcrR family transcriptional regulator